MAGPRARFVITSALVGVAACAGGGDAEAGPSGDSPGARPADASPPAPSAAVQSESFESFWVAFRQAVVAGDKDRIASMTRFPFETRGTMDDDPVKTHDRSSFLGILDRLLDDDAGMTATPEPMRRYVERTTTLTDRNYEPGTAQARVGNFSFSRVGGRWLFTRAYLDE